MAKMYYNLQEAAEKLGVDEQAIRDMVRNGQLREFRDAGKANYRVDDVDKLAAAQQGGGSASADDEAPLELAADDSGSDLQLEDSGPIPVSEASGETPLQMAEDDGGSDAPLAMEESSDMPLQMEESSEIPLSEEPDRKSATPAEDTGPGLSLDSTDTPDDAHSGQGSILAGGETPINLGGSDSSAMKLAGSDAGGELSLEDSEAGTPSKSDTAGASGDALSLDMADEEISQGMKKDDTVITNIGISVFDDEDLEIVDPMAKTVLTPAEDNLGLDGSGAGSGLMDLTREADGTSLGAELLEGIDMGDTQETTAAEGEDEAAAEPMIADGSGGLPAGDEIATPGLPLGGATVAVAQVEAASPAYTGLLMASMIVMVFAAATAVANTMNTVPGYLNVLGLKYFWIFLAGSLVAGGIFAGVGYAAGSSRSGGKRPAKPKPSAAGKKDKPKKKGGFSLFGSKKKKKSPPAATDDGVDAAELELPELDEK